MIMTHVTCRLTAKNRDQLQNHPTLSNRVWATFTFFTCSYSALCDVERAVKRVYVHACVRACVCDVDFAVSLVITIYASCVQSSV